MKPEQRAKIYGKAAEMIFIGQMDFCCTALDFVSGRDSKQLQDFPELLLFSPYEEYTFFPWWPHSAFENFRSVRVIALLFSREIALNP